MKKRCVFNPATGRWRRCCKSACAILQHKVIDVFGMTQRAIHMRWYQCRECKEWLPVFGVATDGPEQIVELRAADLVQQINDVIDTFRISEWHKKSSILHKIANGGEIAGWITYAFDSNAPAIDMDEAAGYLAAALFIHDIDQAAPKSEAA